MKIYFGHLRITEQALKWFTQGHRTPVGTPARDARPLYFSDNDSPVLKQHKRLGHDLCLLVWQCNPSKLPAEAV